MDAHDDEIEAARTPKLLRIAGGVGILAGSIIDLTAIQTLSGFKLFGIYAVAPYLLLTVGSMVVIAGATLLRARHNSALTQLTWSAMGLVVSAGWLLLSLKGGLVSLFGLASPLLAAASLGLAIASLDACDRVNGARKSLAAKGLDLGV